MENNIYIYMVYKLLVLYIVEREEVIFFNTLKIVVNDKVHNESWFFHFEINFYLKNYIIY